jgi:hypothetical protein
VLAGACSLPLDAPYTPTTIVQQSFLVTLPYAERLMLLFHDFSELFLSLKTVKCYNHQIYNKLEAGHNALWAATGTGTILVTRSEQ